MAREACAGLGRRIGSPFLRLWRLASCPLPPRWARLPLLLALSTTCPSTAPIVALELFTAVWLSVQRIAPLLLLPVAGRLNSTAASIWRSAPPRSGFFVVDGPSCPSSFSCTGYLPPSRPLRPAVAFEVFQAVWLPILRIAPLLLLPVAGAAHRRGFSRLSSTATSPRLR